MKNYLLLFVASTLLSAGTVPRTFTGVITDSMCVKDHKSMHVEPDTKCVRECINHAKSVRYVLFDGSKAYKLSDQKTPEQFAATRVIVTGTLFEKTGVIQVEKIEAAKSNK